MLQTNNVVFALQILPFILKVMSSMHHFLRWFIIANISLCYIFSQGLSSHRKAGWSSFRVYHLLFSLHLLFSRTIGLNLSINLSFVLDVRIYPSWLAIVPSLLSDFYIRFLVLLAIVSWQILPSQTILVCLIKP